MSENTDALRDAIKALAGQSTADLVGIAPGSAFSAEELGELGQAFGPVQSVVVLTQHIVDPIQLVRFHYRGPYRESRIATSYADAMLRDACWRVVQVLRAAGCAAAIPRNLRYGAGEPRHGLSYKKAGVLAGLGTFGRNQLLIHPEWGPWMMLRTVVTEAALPCDRPLALSPCEGCRLCLDACPRGALSERGFDRARCEVGVGERQTPEWRALRLSPLGQINCEECMRACPVGVAPPRLETGRWRP
jgi:epoxyqueuosine reductase QueG